MKALIKPFEYNSEEVYLKENELLFSKEWNFVGFLTDFENLNDFVTVTIANIPVVIQNLKGHLRAFKNVCSHRHSIIQNEDKGNRPLMCPYHGWAYNEKGIPAGIPKKPLFSLTKEEVVCLKLEEYKIEVCGNLVFATLNKYSHSLQDFLGDFYDEVATISNSFGKQIDLNEIDIDANWKIVVENTLESYHVALIHAETLYKMGPEGLDFEFKGKHSSWDATLNKLENEGRQAKIHRPYQDRGYKISGYKHILIYPNLLISSTYGVSFNLSLITPKDQDNTNFKSFVFISKNKNDGNSRDLESIFEKSLIDFNRQVFDEDKVICQQVHTGAKFAHHDGELSDEEKRVEHFQAIYKSYMINDK